jgi:pilus assembly protein CpaE
MMIDTHARTARILVLDRTGEFASSVARAAAGMRPPPEVLRLRRPARLGEILATTPVDVVLAGPEEVTPTGLRRLAQVHRLDPKLQILLSPNGRPVAVQDAARSGASDVIPFPASPQRLRSALSRALATADMLRVERVVVREPEMAPAEVKLGHVLTVTSASGGCGKTFFATNLAGYLARASGGKVCLVDLDLQFGEVAVALRLKPERTIAELADDTEGSVALRLAGYVMRHDAGYDVLCAPRDPVSAERVGPTHATAVIEAARAAYDYVVVDTPPSLNEIVLAAFDQSQSLVVMATMDVPSLKNLTVFLSTLERLKVPAEDVSLVLNKAEDGTGIELAQVERLFPQGFSCVLPYAREVSRSINLGMPVVFSEPGAAVSQRFVEGAARLVAPVDGIELPWTSAPPRERRRVRLSFFKKGRLQAPASRYGSPGEGSDPKGANR